MMRVILFLLLIGLIALGAAWLADRPGEVTIVWLGHEVETSVLVAAAAIAALAIAAVIAWSVLRLVLSSPAMLAHGVRRARVARGHRAISQGLIAIGAGDERAARRFAQDAERLAADEPLTLLLKAQAAQIAGDQVAADQTFRAMAAREDTKLLGLRGLYIEARRRDDTFAARGYAEAAATAAAPPPWAGHAVFEFRCATGDWEGALATLEANRKGGLTGGAPYMRQRAVLLTARALDVVDTDPRAARPLALAAAKLAPDLVPAAVLAGRLLIETGETRKAARVLEDAWEAHPHPDLADLYAHLKSGDSARDRLARVQTLTSKRSGHVEGAFAIARAALDAQEFATARAALRPLLIAPTQRVATLMAEIEQVEHGDEGRAREWMARALRAPRDPAWTADGYVSDRWLPLSPVTGRLDAFQWRVPVAALTADADLIANERDAAVLAMPVEAKHVLNRPAANGATPSAPVTASKANGTAATTALSTPRVPGAVIPLVHAPDDPGPAEPSETNGRRGLRQLFRS